MWVEPWRLDILVAFAIVGGITTFVLVGFAGLGIWFWWVEKIRTRPNAKTLKQLKKQWEALPVERR